MKTLVPALLACLLLLPAGSATAEATLPAGKRLFSDPLYADHANLLALGKTIAATPSGEGSYIFLAPGQQEKVIKKATWQTVTLHNRAWRVVLAYRPYE